MYGVLLISADANHSESYVYGSGFGSVSNPEFSLVVEGIALSIELGFTSGLSCQKRPTHANQYLRIHPKYFSMLWLLFLHSLLVSDNL